MASLLPVSQKTIKPPLFGSKYLHNSPLLASNLVSSLEKDPHSDGWKLAGDEAMEHLESTEPLKALPLSNAWPVVTPDEGIMPLGKP